MDVAKCEIRAPLCLTGYGVLGNIHIGAESFINVGLRIGVEPPAHVHIGRDCAIGPNVSFETAWHGVEYVPGVGRGGGTKSISVGDRCWIGARAVILAGVIIGDDSVVGAGAVVTKNVEPGVVVAGVPARTVKRVKPL